MLQIQRGAQSAERECLASVTNEIPLLETAQLGVGNNNRGNRIMPGGLSPGSDPGGWVSLAALSRTQVANRINNVHSAGGVGMMPQPFNPVIRPPSGGVRRPTDPTIYETGYQFNTVAVPGRPFFASKSEPQLV